MVQLLISGAAEELRLTTFAEDGKLAVVSKLELPAASWVIQHPTDKSTFFATGEFEQGTVRELRVSGDKVEIVKTVSSSGAYPTHLAISGSTLYIANYMSGLTHVTLNATSPYLPDDAPKSIDILYTAPAPSEPGYARWNPERQESAHPHQVLVLPTGEVLVPDLGCDKIWRIDGSEIIGFITFPRGAGPRHAVFRDGILYTLLELSSELSAHKLPPLPAEPEHIATLSTIGETKPAPAAPLLPSEIVYTSTVATEAASDLVQPATDAPTEPSPSPRLAAEIHFPPTTDAFPTEFIYTTNRNHPEKEGDTIAIFSVKPFERVALVHTGLNHLRGLEVGPKGEYKYLVAAGQNGGGVKVFERVEGGAQIKEVEGAGLEDESLTAFCWV